MSIVQWTRFPNVYFRIEKVILILLGLELAIFSQTEVQKVKRRIYKNCGKGKIFVF